MKRTRPTHPSRILIYKTEENTDKKIDHRIYYTIQELSLDIHYYYYILLFIVYVSNIIPIISINSQIEGHSEEEVRIFLNLYS